MNLICFKAIVIKQFLFILLLFSQFSFSKIYSKILNIGRNSTSLQWLNDETIIYGQREGLCI